MLKQAALLIGSLAAAATVATALLFSSLAGPRTTAEAAPGGAATAPPTVQVDTVYVAPPAPIQTITVRQSAPSGEGDDDEAEAGSAGDD
jgi:hypothetical protein